MMTSSFLAVNERERMSAGPVGGRPPGTGFGEGELSGGTVGGVPGNGGSGAGGPGGGTGCSGEFGNGLDHILATLEQMADQPAIGVDRRGFLKAAAVLPLGLRAFQPDDWRRYTVTVTVDVLDAKGATKLWIPLPSSTVLPRFQRVDAVDWQPPTHARRETHHGTSLLFASWDGDAATKQMTVRLRVATRERSASSQASGREASALPAAQREHYLRATRWIPTTGLVKETALNIVRAHTTPLARARAIYEWIVENTFRDPAVKGCGTGDIRWMLESGSLGGKCADLNALFVGLCRAAGLPARDLYGLRVAPSREFKSLGRDGDVTTAQHCRAEVFVDDIGWVPVDPADVRKVVLEERPGATLADAHVQRARERLFGTWEMNWIAFNDAHDVALPESKGRMLPFFMYPEVEIAGERRDSLDPERFRYQITAREAE